MNKQLNKRIFQTKENLHKRFLKDNLRQLIIRTSIRTIKTFLETQEGRGRMHCERIG